ncbi:MAG: CUAEP/CCAEP-tail radical SAM protein [Candidatus Acidiferrales bacterium]
MITHPRTLGPLQFGRVRRWLVETQSACHNSRASKSNGSRDLNVVLIATYELGRQPFGLASPAAWLRARGANVACIDASHEPLEEEAIRQADLIAFHVPMHTATRLAVELLASVRALNPRAHFCFYGLYAPVNEAYLRKLGVHTILGGEFENGLASLVERLGRGESRGLQPEPVISITRQEFLLPDRRGFLPLDRYARLHLPDGVERLAGYTESSRGCKHLCRHCPIVPVYNGVFRVVARDVVLDDIRQQVAAGAAHITFGDADFFNGVGHALPLIAALHREFPALTYDVTIKIEHLLHHRAHLATLRDTGCLFVTSAVESIDDAVLDRLAKNHTRADFLRVVEAFRETGLTLQPTFVPFTPWTTLDSFCELLDFLRVHALFENVAPIQLAIRLLIPAGSRLLELTDIQKLVGPFDESALAYPWKHADPRVDALCAQLQKIVSASEKLNLFRVQIFARMTDAARLAAGLPPLPANPLPIVAARPAIPYLTEPWYCCAEPSGDQLASMRQIQKSISGASAFV